MRKWLFTVALSLMLFCSKGVDDNLAGTATDVNSGSISGLVINDGALYCDVVSVELYRGDTILAKRLAIAGDAAQSLQTANGSYMFDSLSAGVYSIRVVKDSIALGQDIGIRLEASAHISINITINVIINQSFYVTVIDSSKHVIINNYYIINSPGKVDTVSQGNFIASFLDKDTVLINTAIVANGVPDTVTIVFVKQSDGSYVSLPLTSDKPIDVQVGPVITNGRVDLLDISNWMILSGSAHNSDSLLMVGDFVAGGDKILSKASFRPPFTMIWYGSFPATTLSYHTMALSSSDGNDAFSFWTRYQNSGVLGYTVVLSGTADYTLAPSINANNSEIKGAYKTVCENDSVGFFYNDSLIIKRSFPFSGPMQLSFTCYERPFVLDSVFVWQR